MSVTIKALPNGPYLVDGGCELFDAAGQRIDHAGKLALCRCGHSATKPFCDGTHARVGFKDGPPKAP